MKVLVLQCWHAKGHPGDVAKFFVIEWTTNGVDLVISLMGKHCLRVRDSTMLTAIFSGEIGTGIFMKRNKVWKTLQVVFFLFLFASLLSSMLMPAGSSWRVRCISVSRMRMQNIWRARQQGEEEDWLKSCPGLREQYDWYGLGHQPLYFTQSLRTNWLGRVEKIMEVSKLERALAQRKEIIFLSENTDKKFSGKTFDNRTVGVCCESGCIMRFSRKAWEWLKREEVVQLKYAIHYWGIYFSE